MKKALLTGISGQDAGYLAEILLDKGYEVHGLARRTAIYPESLKNIKHLDGKIHIHFGDLATENHLCRLISELQPTELYNLGGQSDVAASFSIPEYTGDVTGLGVTRVLEAVREFSPKTKVYLAGSSEMFGNAAAPQNEQTPLRARSPYGAAKIYGFNMGVVYREAYGMFVCNGILGNHESPKRGMNFVTRKISHAAASIYLGLQNKLELGNLDAVRDWGYSKDYMLVAWMMLQQNKPDDFCVGTGEAHTVQHFVESAFSMLGLYWKDYVVINPAFKRPAEVNYLMIDSGKARRVLGWRPQTSFTELVEMMVNSDLELLRSKEKVSADSR